MRGFQPLKLPDQGIIPWTLPLGCKLINPDALVSVNGTRAWTNFVLCKPD